MMTSGVVGALCAAGGRCYGWLGSSTPADWATPLLPSAGVTSAVVVPAGLLADPASTGSRVAAGASAAARSSGIGAAAAMEAASAMGPDSATAAPSAAAPAGAAAPLRPGG